MADISNEQTYAMLHEPWLTCLRAMVALPDDAPAWQDVDLFLGAVQGLRDECKEKASRAYRIMNLSLTSTRCGKPMLS